MENFFDNKSKLFGDDLKKTITKGVKVQIAASIFSIYGYKALESELKKIDKLEFIFKDPIFIKKEQSRNQEKQMNKKNELSKKLKLLKSREELLNGCTK